MLTHDPFGKNCSPDLVKLPPLSILLQSVIFTSTFLYLVVSFYGFLPRDSASEAE